MIDYQKISEEYIKCYSDKSRIYMIEHYLKTYDATQKREVPYILFPRQKILCQAMGNANNVVLTKPRQSGCTTTAAGFMSCEMVLADKDAPQTVLIIGNTLDLAQQMLVKILEFLMQFPLWMWGDTQEFIDLGYNICEPPINENVIFKIHNSKELKLKNGCKVVARSSGPDASRGVGGVTWLIFDEMAFIENGADVYASAVPTVSTGGHIIGISTPNGLDPLYSALVSKAKLKGTKDWNNFELVEMKWYQDPRYNRFLEWTRKNGDNGDYDIIKEKTIDEKGNIVYDEERWEILIKEGWKPRSPWYTTMCQQFNYDTQKIAQELDVSFLGSDSTVVAPEFVEMQLELNVREPNPELKDKTLDDLWIWKEPIPGHRYIIPIDNSRGSADDATALEIIDIDGIDDDGMPCVEQVGEYNGKLTGDAVGELAFQYGMLYNQAFIIVEDIGGYGAATLLMLQRLGYPNLYYDDPSLKKFTSQEEATTTQVTEKGLPGFHSSSVRFQMLSNFANMVKTNQFKIRSKRVINELRTWIFKNGRIDHKDGCHDDTLTCLAMGLFVLIFSINKLEKQKEKDSAILKATIAVNNRIIHVPLNRDKQRQIDSLIYNSNQTPNPYKQYMWLIK